MSDRPGLLPRPLLSLMVAVTWLMANNTIYVGHVILAVFLGIVLPRLTYAFWPGAPKLHRPGVALRLLAVFAYDIVVANFHVARLVLGPSSKLRPAFIEVPLDLHNDFAISLLASMITLTPGTVTVDYDPDRAVIHVHALDVDDTAAMVAEIKQRYEAPLKEALGC
jgi:multicomponent K+:H+ antiporter subunit E